MFAAALIIILAAHLVCMNVACGAPLVAMWLEWRSRGSRDGLAASAADYLTRWSALALLAGAALGLLLGIALWTDAYRELWVTRLSYKMRVAVIELVVSLALLAVCWLWRASRRPGGTAGAVTRIVLLLLASTNLLYHFPFLFLVASKLSDSGQTSGAVIGAPLFRRLMLSDELPALATHFALASLAMAGLMLLGLALRIRRQGAPEEDYARLSLWGGRVALVPTLLQLPVGLWVLSSLPATMQNRLMGNDAAATLCFLASLAAALWLMRELVAIALGERERSQLIRAMVLMVAVVMLMTASQQLARGPRPVSDEAPAAAARQAADPVH